MNPQRYTITAARDGDLYQGETLATDQAAAEAQAFALICEEFRLDVEDYENLDELAGDLDGLDVAPDARHLYRDLADGLSDMIEGGRLTESDIPDDYAWLVELLAKIAAQDPGDPSTTFRDHAVTAD